jgi:serine/threonine protein kinase
MLNLVEEDEVEVDEAEIDRYLNRTMKMWKVETTTIEQLHSSISFVFRLCCAEDKTSLVLKSFSRNSLKNDFSQVETTLREKEIKQSLVSSYIMNVSGTEFFVFEGLLPPKSRQNAKACLVPLLDSVKVAIDELHQNDIAHLDIHLHNICFRKDGTAVLIDLERCKNTVSCPWFKESSSCMYREGYSREQIDHLQVYWMAFWILSHPTDLNYHDMDKMDIKKLQGENEECVALCKELFEFIKDLPKTYAPEQWERFKSMIGHLSPNPFSSAV